MSYVFVAAVCLVLGAYAGILIGRKNPKVSDVAFKVANKAKQ